MENELYKKVYQIVMKTYRKTNLKRAKFTDADVVLIYLWAVLHDRPTCWACNKNNWPIYYRKRLLPDPSTMCRRLRKHGVQLLLRQTEKSLINTSARKLCQKKSLCMPFPSASNRAMRLYRSELIIGAKNVGLFETSHR